MIKQVFLTIAIMGALLSVDALGESKWIGVCRPENSGRLEDSDIDTIWMTLETEARKVSDASGKYKVMPRGTFKAIFDSADFKRNSDLLLADDKNTLGNLKNISYLLSSSVGALTGGKYVLNMSLIDCSSGENVAGSSQSRSFISLSDLVDELEPMVSMCIKCVCAPPLVAVLKTVVLNPLCPQQYGDVFQNTLASCLLQSKVRLALLDDIRLKLRENGIDAMQSIPPAQYPKVAKFLQVKYLVLSELTSCDLHVIELEPKLQQRRQKLVTGTISGCLRVVDMSGEIKALIPFDTVFDFNEMIAKGEIDVRGWNDSQYRSQMIYLTVVQNLPELMNSLK